VSHRLKDHIKQSAPFESDAQIALLNLFVASSFMRQQIEQACNRRDISFNHYNILRILGGAPEGGYSRADIIGRMMERGSDTTRLIDRMVKLGLVVREKSDDDRRRSLHRLTGRGRNVLKEMAPDIKAIQQSFESRVAPKDLAELSRICEGIYLGAE
jgi:DNA-binding MarR family transcriptional regulator